MQATDHITILADAVDHNDLKRLDAPQHSKIYLNASDDVVFDVTLLRRNEIVDGSDISRITLEIFDIGDVNSSEPRTETRLVYKEILAAEIAQSLTRAMVDSGACHTSFALSASDTAIGAGDKWLKICAYDLNDKRTTFGRAWIDIDNSRGDTPNITDAASRGNTYVKSEDANAFFCRKNQNLADIASPSIARTNLNVYGKDDTDSLIASHVHSDYATKTYVDSTRSKLDDLMQTATRKCVARFTGGGALACLGTPCAEVKSRAYLFTMSLDEDWDVSQSINDYNRRLNVIGDIMVSGGLYTGISFRIDMSGIVYVVCEKTTSGEVNLSTNKKCGEIFGGSSDTVIPAGIYSVVVSVEVGETSSTGYIYVNGVLKDSRTLTTLTASNFNLNTSKSFAVGNSGNYNALDFTKSALKCAMSRVRVLNRAITADAVKNPANCNWTFSFASGETTSSGQYFFGRSDTNSFPAKCQATLLLRASGACSVNLGSGTSANTSAYASGVSLAANAWTRVEICNDAALMLSPSATLSAATTVEAILTINQNY